MTTKPKKPVPTAAMTDEERAKAVAIFSLEPIYNGAAVVGAFSGSTFGTVDPIAAAGELKRQCEAVHGGDLERIESMLTAQAHSLDVIFTSMARRAALNAGEYMGPTETYLKLALKAQNQCRATLETLATIKNPPVVIAKQANIAHGPQQVNNECAHIARVEEIEKPQTELLEHDHGQRLDRGAAAAAGESYRAVEAVATVHRPTHTGRQSHGQP